MFLRFNKPQIKGVWFMKKFFTVLLCTFLFLLDENSITNTNVLAKTKEVEAKVLIQEKIETKEEEQEVAETEPEEIADSTITETSSTEEYTEDSYTAYEPYSVNYGTYGRLHVSWFDVALYDYNVYTWSGSSLQELVDNYDSAAFYVSKGKLVIADHDYQGFNALYDLYEGSYSYIQFADGSTIGYTLIRKEKEYNTGPDLVDAAGNSFFNMDSDLIMYTCYDGGIMVTLWALA